MLIDSRFASRVLHASPSASTTSSRAQPQTQLLADDGGEQRVRALADVGGAAEHGGAAAAIELELHARLGHLVRVDAVVGAADVHAAGDPDPAAVRQAPELLAPARGALDRVQALRKAVRGDAHAVDRVAVGAHEVAAA